MLLMKWNKEKMKQNFLGFLRQKEKCHCSQVKYLYTRNTCVVTANSGDSLVIYREKHRAGFLPYSRSEKKFG